MSLWHLCLPPARVPPCCGAGSWQFHLKHTAFCTRSHETILLYPSSLTNPRFSKSLSIYLPNCLYQKWFSQSFPCSDYSCQFSLNFLHILVEMEILDCAQQSAYTQEGTMKAHSLISLPTCHPRTGKASVAWWIHRLLFLPLSITFPNKRMETTRGFWPHSCQEQHGSKHFLWQTSRWPSGGLGLPFISNLPQEVPCRLCKCISLPGRALYAHIPLSLTVHPDLSIHLTSCLFTSNENSNYSTKLFWGGNNKDAAFGPTWIYFKAISNMLLSSRSCRIAHHKAGCQNSALLQLSRQKFNINKNNWKWKLGGEEGEGNRQTNRQRLTLRKKTLKFTKTFSGRREYTFILKNSVKKHPKMGLSQHC